MLLNRILIELLLLVAIVIFAQQKLTDSHSKTVNNQTVPSFETLMDLHFELTLSDFPILLMSPNMNFQFLPGITSVLSHLKRRSNPLSQYMDKYSTTKLVLAYLSLVIMLQAGDLHPNPGPYQPKFPCELCGKAARWNQRAVSCDECNGWYHVDCMSMSTVVYNVLANNSKVEWICCQCGMPNFSSSLFSNSDLHLSNSFDCLSDNCSNPPNTSAANQSDISSSSSELPSSPLATSSPTKLKSRYKPKRPRKQLKVLVVNFQGLRDKTADLACCLEQHCPDIIVGTETNLNNSINSSELFPEGYYVLRKDRTFGRVS